MDYQKIKTRTQYIGKVAIITICAIIIGVAILTMDFGSVQATRSVNVSVADPVLMQLEHDYTRTMADYVEADKVFKVARLSQCRAEIALAAYKLTLDGPVKTKLDLEDKVKRSCDF